MEHGSRGGEDAEDAWEPAATASELRDAARTSSMGSDVETYPSQFLQGMSYMAAESQPDLSERGDRSVQAAAAALAGSSRFQNTTMAVIITNALWLGIDTDYNHIVLKKDGVLPLEPTSTVIEQVFCVYFTFEILVRFLAFPRKLQCFRDAWFIFDFTLVFFMVLETWVLAIVRLIIGGADSSALSNFSALRLIRLLRITRMAHLMHSIPELFTLVKGMISAARAVFFIMMFLVLILYVFAILITSQVGDPATEEPGPDDDPTGEQMFASMGDSMMTLLTNGVLGDNLVQAIDAILPLGVFWFWFFLVFMFISSMTLLNMLIGVLCEVMSTTAQEQEDEASKVELRICLQEAFSRLDLNSDGHISDMEWAQMASMPDIREQFIKLGIEECMLDESLAQFQLAIFHSTPSDIAGVVKGKGNRTAKNSCMMKIPIEEIFEKIAEIRPHLPASNLSLEVVRADIERNRRAVDRRLVNAETILQNIAVAKGVALPADGDSLRRLGSSRRLSPLKAPPTLRLPGFASTPEAESGEQQPCDELGAVGPTTVSPVDGLGGGSEGRHQVIAWASPKASPDLEPGRCPTVTTSRPTTPFAERPESAVGRAVAHTVEARAQRSEAWGDLSTAAAGRMRATPSGLREVPTELLLHTLKRRFPQPEPRFLVGTPGIRPDCARYSCVQKVSTEDVADTQECADPAGEEAAVAGSLTSTPILPPRPTTATLEPLYRVACVTELEEEV